MKRKYKEYQKYIPENNIWFIYGERTFLDKDDPYESGSKRIFHSSGKVFYFGNYVKDVDGKPCQNDIKLVYKSISSAFARVRKVLGRK